MECQPSPPPPYHSLVANSLETSKYATFSSPNQCPGMIPQCTLFSHDFPASLCLQSPSLDQRLGNGIGCVFRCWLMRCFLVSLWNYGYCARVVSGVLLHSIFAINVLHCIVVLADTSAVFHSVMTVGMPCHVFVD